MCANEGIIDWQQLYLGGIAFQISVRINQFCFSPKYEKKAWAVSVNGGGREGY